MHSVCEHVDGSWNRADGVVSTGQKRGRSRTASADLVSADSHEWDSSRNGFSPETDNRKADVSRGVRCVTSSDSKTELAASDNQEAPIVRRDSSSSNSNSSSSEESMITEERKDKEAAVVVAASVRPNIIRLSERASAFSIDALLQTKPRRSLLITTSADDDDNAAYAQTTTTTTKRTRPRHSAEYDRTSGIEINRHRRRMKLNDGTSDTVMVPAAESAAALAPSHPDSSLHNTSDGYRSDGVCSRSSVVSEDVADAACGADGGKKGACGAEGDETLGVVCQLEANELWNRFHELGTEMIITKSGRRMFPVLSVSFSGLVPDETYLVATDMVPVDNKRYRYTYHRSAWLVAGRADPQPTTSGLHVHPDCPMTGRQLNRHAISFERIKLTNSNTPPNTLTNKSGHIILASMHKYQPRIHLIQRSAALALSVADDRASSPSGLLQSLRKEHYRTFTFPETEFIAVTAYQNQMITKLKIDSNPFAKGFRDSTRLMDLDREGYSGSAGEFEGFNDLHPASFPNPSALFPGALSSSISSSHNSIPMQKMLQDASSKMHQDNPTRSSAFNHVHSSYLSSSIAEKSFDFPSTQSSSVSKPTAMNSLRCSPKLLKRKSHSWQSAHDQQSRDRNPLMDSRLPVSDAETRQQLEIYRMITLLPRPSIGGQFSTMTDLTMSSPAVMAAANSYSALRYHPYLAATTVAKLHLNSLQS